MKDSSIISKLHHDQAELSKVGAEKRKQANQQRQQFFTDAKSRRVSFMGKYRVEKAAEAARFNQRRLAETEKLLTSLDWNKVFSNDAESMYFKESGADKLYLRIESDSFSIYRNPKKQYAGYTGDVPETGPMNLVELEDQAKTV